MSASTPTEVDIRDLPYADNDEVAIADRIAAEINEGANTLAAVSGYFSPTVWSLLGPALSKLDNFRLLLGKDYELDRLEPNKEQRNIEKLVQAAIRQDTEPQGLITQDQAQQLTGLIAFLEHHREARPDDEVVRLWRGEEFFHAKAYILREDTKWRSYGIGSANFTLRGLSRNRELMGWRQDNDTGKQVEAWFNRHWENEAAEPYTDELVTALRATPLVSDAYTPYDVLIRTLAGRYGSEPPPELEGSGLTLHWFQEDAVIRLLKLLNGPARGALLADAVGLGKTYMAMSVIRHYVYDRVEKRRGTGPPVLLIVPASLRDYWQGELHRNGLAWACELITMQSLRSDFDPTPHAGADLIVIDEAHRLRGEGAWFRKANDLLQAGAEKQRKRVLLLTATPVNTGMRDLVNLLRLLTKNESSVWAPDIADFRDYLNAVEKHKLDPFPVLDRSLVRRSRSDIVRMAEEKRLAGAPVEPLKLPKRKTAHIDYSYATADEGLFDEFAHTLRRLVLVPYDLDRFRADEVQPLFGGDDEVAYRPGSLAALCAAGLLARFQSSLPAIERSLRRVDAVMRRTQEALDQDPPRLLDLRASLEIKRLLAEDSLAGEDQDDEESGTADEERPVDATEARWQTAIEACPALPDPAAYNLAAIADAIAQDRDAIAALLAALPNQADDGKIDALLSALTRAAKNDAKGRPGLAGRKGVLIFSQFRDTARYLHSRLTEHADVLGYVEITDGAVSSDQRRQRSAFFDPSRADAAKIQAAHTDRPIPKVLVSTDVLAEGHNLQVADVVINFDLHFNPQVAVQRCGRIDRLDSPNEQVHLVSMLPPEDLDAHLGLLARLDERFRRIHGLGLGDEQVTTLQGDRPGQTIEQLRRLYNDDETVLDEIERSWTFGSTDYMRSPLSAFLHSAGFERLSSIPVGLASVRFLPKDWPHGEGVFLSLGAPAAGRDDRQTFWRFYSRMPGGGYSTPVGNDVEIFRAIHCGQTEPRAPLDPVPAGPGVFDWALIQHAAAGLAAELNQKSAAAELHRGASQKSNRLRMEILAKTEDLDKRPETLDDLLDRLEQVRVEDYDAVTRGSQFEAVRKQLGAAETMEERETAARLVAEEGLALFGHPVSDDVIAQTREVLPADIQLVAYEALVKRPGTAPEAFAPKQTSFEMGDVPPTLTPG